MAAGFSQNCCSQPGLGTPWAAPIASSCWGALGESLLHSQEGCPDQSLSLDQNLLGSSGTMDVTPSLPEEEMSPDTHERRTQGHT
jgi:hypothetical protein